MNDYICDYCNHRFTFFVSFNLLTPVCPKCGDKNVTPVKTSEKIDTYKGAKEFVDKSIKKEYDWSDGS